MDELLKAIGVVDGAPSAIYCDKGGGFKDPAFSNMLHGKSLRRFPATSAGQPGGCPDLHPHENSIALLNGHLKNNPKFVFRIKEHQINKPWFESGANFLVRLKSVIDFMNTDEKQQKSLENICRSFNSRLNKVLDKKGAHIGK